MEFVRSIDDVQNQEEVGGILKPRPLPTPPPPLPPLNKEPTSVEG